MLEAPKVLAEGQFFAPELLWDALKNKLQFYNMEVPDNGAQIFSPVACTKSITNYQTIHEFDDGRNDKEKAAIKVFIDKCRENGKWY